MIKTKLIAYAQLMRADRPIGTVLLACPMLWALWLAGKGYPPADVVLIFLLGAFVMRSAGCVINDFADRNFDKDVERTKARPLTSGQVSVGEALLVFAALIVTALILLSFLPLEAVLPACLAFALSCLYPFTKRFFKIPQLVLGMSFSTSVLMAYMTLEQHLSARAWVLFIAVTVWTIVYDTYYAMVDRDDDIDIGIHSSALWFGHYDLLINAILMGVFVICMLLVGVLNALGVYYYLGLLAACGCLAYQLMITRQRERDACFTAFLNNQWVGIFVFIGILLNSLA